MVLSLVVAGNIFDVNKFSRHALLWKEPVHQNVHAIVLSVEIKRIRTVIRVAHWRYYVILMRFTVVIDL